MKLKLISMAVAMSATFATPLMAFDILANDIRFGGLIGQSKFDIDCGGCSVDDTDIAFGANVSYNVSNRWGVEAGLMDFGSSSYNFTGFSSQFKASSFYAVGTGTINFAEKWSLTGRLGLSSLSATGSARVSRANVSGSGQEPMIGFSVDYRINSKFSAGLRMDTVDDISATSIAVKYFLN